MNSLKNVLRLSVIPCQQSRLLSSSYFQNNKNNDSNNENSNDNSPRNIKLIGAGAIATFIVGNSILQTDLLAEEKENRDIEHEIIERENR